MTVVIGENVLSIRASDFIELNAWKNWILRIEGNVIILVPSLKLLLSGKTVCFKYGTVNSGWLIL